MLNFLCKSHPTEMVILKNAIGLILVCKKHMGKKDSAKKYEPKNRCLLLGCLTRLVVAVKQHDLDDQSHNVSHIKI